jgi:hypothetical protein
MKLINRVQKSTRAIATTRRIAKHAAIGPRRGRAVQNQGRAVQRGSPGAA